MNKKIINARAFKRMEEDKVEDTRINEENNE